MRKVARVSAQGADARWVIVHEASEGVYVFPCASDDDGSATGDDWYSSLAEADAACAEAYGIEEGDWRFISDPRTGCQQDWVTPVRVIGREIGAPRWGEFERLVDGAWITIDSSSPPLTIEAAIQQADAPDGPSSRR